MTANRTSKVMVENRTGYTLYLYYRGISDHVLEICLSTRPENDEKLERHNEYVLEAAALVSIPLNSWKSFSGVKLDTSRIKDICLRNRQFAIRNTDAFKVVIEDLLN